MSKAKRTPPKVTTTTPFGPDVDLTKQVVRDAKGQRVTKRYSDNVVAQARRGRPSLDSGPSPQVAFRIPASLRDRAAQIAAAEGKTVSQLAREALEQRLSESA